jgi:hypothetical protein
MHKIMQENIEQPLGKLTIHGKKWHLEKSLKYKGIVELCVWGAWWPLGHLHGNFWIIYDRLTICLRNTQTSNQN